MQEDWTADYSGEAQVVMTPHSPEATRGLW